VERWFSAASAHWAPSTVRQTRSVITHRLLPHLGHLAVTKLTTADIDDLFAHDGGLAGWGLADRSYRPQAHPWQVSAAVDVVICELRRAHPTPPNR
jgi:Phage integrase, N-terminal SAM-like domain